jgi:hypothetical protein
VCDGFAGADAAGVIGKSKIAHHPCKSCSAAIGCIPNLWAFTYFLLFDRHSGRMMRSESICGTREAEKIYKGMLTTWLKLAHEDTACSVHSILKARGGGLEIGS